MEPYLRRKKGTIVCSFIWNWIIHYWFYIFTKKILYTNCYYNPHLCTKYLLHYKMFTLKRQLTVYRLSVLNYTYETNLFPFVHRMIESWYCGYMYVKKTTKEIQWRTSNFFFLFPPPPGHQQTIIGKLL